MLRNRRCASHLTQLILGILVLRLIQFKNRLCSRFDLQGVFVVVGRFYDVFCHREPRLTNGLFFFVIQHMLLTLLNNTNRRTDGFVMNIRICMDLYCRFRRRTKNDIKQPLNLA